MNLHWCLALLQCPIQPTIPPRKSCTMESPFLVFADVGLNLQIDKKHKTHMWNVQACRILFISFFCRRVKRASACLSVEQQEIMYGLPILALFVCSRWLTISCCCSSRTWLLVFWEVRSSDQIVEYDHSESHRDTAFWEMYSILRCFWPQRLTSR